MKILLILVCLITSVIHSQEKSINLEDRVTSRVDSTDQENLVLIQELTINAPIEPVWAAFTTKEGWQSWSVPLAEVDFRLGGAVRSNYEKNGKIGDKNTIVNHIINYVPNKLITLQAELSPHFPEFMKKDAKDFYNVIYFEEISKSETKISSYGIGYKKNEKYLSLLKFFITANESVYKKLISYLER
jgi:uncharacterized protein YndB with AHSA1/START domain